MVRSLLIAGFCVAGSPAPARCSSLGRSSMRACHNLVFGEVLEGTAVLKVIDSSSPTP